MTARKKTRGATLLQMERLGLSNDEIRLIGGFRGLTNDQQQAVLTLQAMHVIHNARMGSYAREARNEARRVKRTAAR